MNLVRDMPHVTARGAEGDGRTYFLDIFTWRDPNVSDTTPAEIRRIACQSALVGGLHSLFSSG